MAPRKRSLERGPGGRAKVALTPRIIDALQPGEEVADAAKPGLRVRAAETLDERGKSIKTFFYRYRSPIDGAVRQVRIGPFGAVTLAKAREAVEKFRVGRSDGVDPQLTRRGQRAEVRRAHAEAKRAVHTLADAADRYLVNYVERNRSAKASAEVRRMFERDVLPVLGARPIAELQRAEIVALVRDIADRAPHVAQDARREIRAALHRAADDGLIGPERAAIADNLLRGDRRMRQTSRDRILSPAEVAKLVRWMPEHYSRTVRDALMLTLYTGSRAGEVVSWRRDWYDAAGGTITMPTTKSGKPFTVTLSRQAVKIIEARRKVTGESEHIFPSRNGGHVEQKALGVEVYAHSGASESKVYANLARCPVRGWTPHDLRRTARSLLQSLGCPFEVGERILNHTLPGVAAVYARADLLDERREWLQRLADHVDALASDKVVPIGRVA